MSDFKLQEILIEEMILKGAYKEALKEIEKILETNSVSKISLHRILLLKSRVFVNCGSFKEAEAIINIILTELIQKEDPLLFIDLLIVQINVKWRLGHLDESLELIKKCSELITSLKDIEKNDILSRQASLLSHEGVNYWYKGNLETALKCFTQGLTIAETIENKQQIAKLLHNIGLIHHNKGNIDDSLEYYTKSIDIKREIGDINGLNSSLNNIAVILKRQGDLDQALQIHLDCLEFYQKMEVEIYIGLAYNNIALIYYAKGEIDRAIEYNQKSLEIREKLGQKIDYAESLLNIGVCYLAKGKKILAEEYLIKSLDFNYETGNSSDISHSLYYLILLSVESNEIDKGKKYLDKLIEIKDEEIKIINLRYILAKAYLLNTSDRLQDKAEAQRIFRKVSDEKTIVSQELTVSAMLNLCDLLLLEFKIFSSEEALSEIAIIIKVLLDIAISQNSYSLQTKTYLLSSKLALIKFDIDEASTQLSKAKNIAIEKGLWRLAIALEKEENLLINQKIKWEELKNNNSTLLDRVELTNIEVILKRMIRMEVENLKMLPEFAVEYIRACLFKMGNTGPEIAIYESLPFKKSTKEILNKIAVYYTVVLGQGEGRNLGLYGPLPIPDVPDHVAITYSFIISDPSNVDPRNEGNTYSILVLIMPQSLIELFSNRNEIEEKLNQEFMSIRTIKEINDEFLKNLRYSLLNISQKNSIV